MTEKLMCSYPFFATLFLLSGGYPQHPNAPLGSGVSQLYNDMGGVVPSTSRPRSSLHYIYPNVSDPEEMKRTIKRYTEQLFSPIG